MSVDVVSLGCRLNHSEAEALRGFLSDEDDLVVVNSCAVTNEAVRQTRQAIRRARRSRPSARLLVTGCAAEIERDTLAAMPEVDGLIANAAKLDPRAWNASPAAQAPALGRTRAFVQVQNGCDHACTFCVIPQGRGPGRSRPVTEVVSEVRERLAQGVLEVVLTGVDLTSWGSDLEGDCALGDLVSAILSSVPDLPRLRLSSIDGAEVDAVLFDLLAHEPRVMPHVHLSLQSGDDMVLKRMKRRHTRKDALRLVARLREARADIAVGADLIAGFPTETDAMHASSLAIVRDLHIVHGHIFPYSARRGTPAARMPQVSPDRIKERAAQLRAAVSEERDRWLAGHIGRPLSVLGERDGKGLTPDFAPVHLPPGALPGTLLTITPRAVSNGVLA